jgi:hypothetical protein
MMMKESKTEPMKLLISAHIEQEARRAFNHKLPHGHNTTTTNY